MAYEFRAEIKGLHTGRQLGQDTAAAVTGRVTLEFNALGVNLNRLVRLQKSGQLAVSLVPTQAELPLVEDGADLDAGDEAPAG